MDIKDVIRQALAERKIVLQQEIDAIGDELARLNADPPMPKGETQKVHWTQTPAGKKKLKAREAAKKAKGGPVPTASLKPSEAVAEPEPELVGTPG